MNPDNCYIKSRDTCMSCERVHQGAPGYTRIYKRLGRNKGGMEGDINVKFVSCRVLFTQEDELKEK